MSKSKQSTSGDSQTIEQLQQRYDRLSHERTRVEERMTTAQNQLQELRKKAVEQFGTDDVKKLRKQLLELKSENEAKRAAYQSDLDKIETRLSDVENQFGEPQTGNPELSSS